MQKVVYIVYNVVARERERVVTEVGVGEPGINEWMNMMWRRLWTISDGLDTNDREPKGRAHITIKLVNDRLQKGQVIRTTTTRSLYRLIAEWMGERVRVYVQACPIGGGEWRQNGIAFNQYYYRK